ncbi:class I SAM-dependent methyltransferase [Lysinibacillus sphaericus]|uniref:class I SAM-dependent methyltransferase n=1 Tax=Lysinibacillus sphaericus TaxID=1421 RepID=UPI001E3B1337|nr:class I SAM-dependent methyltransferase [Lysinibacillus sphaericus]UDK95483.1 class I SAM-dependent methyltransferase [Lysinibacillus sphaericus]
MSYINKQYWEDFYKDRVDLTESSTFSDFILKKREQNINNVILIDLGCGTGKDTFYFAKNGFDVIGIDGSEEVIKINNDIMKKHFNTNNIYFACVDLSDVNEVQKLMAKFNDISISQEKEILFYTRFFLHAITEETENLIFQSILANIQIPCEIVAEFRTKEDEELDKVFDDHYRRYIDTDLLITKLIKLGFSIQEFSKGRGFSIYKNENPFLARIILKKN